MKTILCLFLAAFSAVSAAPTSGQFLPPGDSAVPTLYERVKNAGTSKEYQDVPYLIVLDSTVNRVDSLGVTRGDHYIIYKVLNEDGCRRLAVLNWGYEPLSSYIDIRSVAVIRGDSQLTVPVDDVKDLPAPQRMIYWSDRVKMLQLPRLQVGDGIEVLTFRKGYSYALLDQSAEPNDNKYIPPMRGEYFDIVLFQATVPVIDKMYMLTLPSGKRLHSKIYNGPMYSGTSYAGDTTFYFWWAKNVPAWSPEPSEPDASDFLPKVVLATAESWEAKSRWFFDVNEPQFAATDAIRAKVKEILSAAGVANGTDEQKAFELVHWVAQNIRYSGQSMGKGEGYTLHPGAMIFEQRSGVCKDIAGMLITMMRAAGLDAHPAMTMAGSRIEDLPADQFNHCVVALRKADGSYEMYDPTWVPNYKDIWSKSESEQDYLIGSESGEHLRRIRYSPPGESPMKVTNTAKILPDGTLEGTFDFQSDGSMDSRLRRLFVGSPKSELGNSLTSMLHVISDRVEVTSIDHGDAYDFHKSMWWKIGYRIPEYAMKVDHGYEFRSPVMQLTLNSYTLFGPGTHDWPEKRHDDLFFYTTQLLDASETIALPAGFKVVAPKSAQKIDETYASFTGTCEMVGGSLKIAQKAEVRRRQIPPSGYAGFRKAVKEARTYAETVFRAEKGGSR
jgi:hypothetical protein